MKLAQDGGSPELGAADGRADAHVARAIRGVAGDPGRGLLARPL